MSPEYCRLFAYKKAYKGGVTGTPGAPPPLATPMICDTFTEHCKAAGIGSSRSLAQIKEKWRALFERYKAIVDNSKKTGRGRESFEFFEIMDEFLGCSDKVRPKFVKQTAPITGE